MTDLKSLLTNIAPTIATALGGPAAGIAVKFLSDKLLGKPNATPEEIAQAINSATPEQLIKLKELDANFAIEMGRQGVDLYKTEVDDRKDARKYKDVATDILAFVYISAFFGTIFYFSKAGTLNSESNLIAGLRDVLILIFSYYFGSSAGSRVKDYFPGKK